jgi:tetratricopeptide (TPR) repeat protein
MARIFLSYRREDSGGWAGRLYDRLSQHFGDEHIFMDIDTIEPGLDFVEVIQHAVQSCDVLLALIGRQWLTVADATGQPRLANPEDFVRLEIATALERDIRVIPVLVQGAPMPRAADLPDDLKRLSRRNALEVRDIRFHNDVDQLITVLDPHQPSVFSRLWHMIQLWERFHLLRHMIQLWKRFHLPHPSAMSVRIGLVLTVLVVVGGLSIWLVQRNDQAELAQQYNLAEQYYKDENYDQAVQWYRKAAEQGHAGAQYSLGRMYDLGWGVAEDNDQAVQWYRKAAEQGHAGAQYNLGMMYDRGGGGAKDAIQAVQWYRKAAKQGYAMAQDELRRRGLSW